MLFFAVILYSFLLFYLTGKGRKYWTCNAILHQNIFHASEITKVLVGIDIFFRSEVF